MKKLIITTVLVLVASNAQANIDPVVSEYQKIDALQKTAPLMAETFILVNSRTAVSCDQVSSLDSLIKFDEVLELQNYIRQKGGMDGSDRLVGLIDAATISVCQLEKQG